MKELDFSQNNFLGTYFDEEERRKIDEIEKRKNIKSLIENIKYTPFLTKINLSGILVVFRKFN